MSWLLTNCVLMTYERGNDLFQYLSITLLVASMMVIWLSVHRLSRRESLFWQFCHSKFLLWPTRLGTHLVRLLLVARIDPTTLQTSAKWTLFFHKETAALESKSCPKFFNIFFAVFTRRPRIIRRPGDQLEIILLGKVHELLRNILRPIVRQELARHTITRKMRLCH